MKTYEFTIILTVDAPSKNKAKEKADIVMQNLNEMMGHAPFSCDLELQDGCTKVEYEDSEDTIQDE